MQINFKSIRIHHFMSFDDATLSFTDRGYCLISGVNENPKDAAKSNGSGKSTIFNAISFALVGETLQGLKSNLANINFDDGCFVELDFEVNGDEYKLIRSKDDVTYGTNLKIYVNNEDKSGKGIRESQEILDTYLPDLTSELIGSVIILGQGLPQKFTSNTPSGRKEVLEHLSKSDFMIQDLKDRIERRQKELNEKYTLNNNEMISINSQLEVYDKQKQLKESEYETYKQEVDYNAQIEALQKEYDKCLSDKAKAQELYNNWNKLYLDKSAELGKMFGDSANQRSDLEKTHQNIEIEFHTKILTLDRDIKNIEEEITKLKNITDVCPTCGQKIPNVIKPDTSKQEAQLVEMKKNLATVQEECERDKAQFNEALIKCRTEWDNIINKVKDEVAQYSLQASNSEAEKSILESKCSNLYASIVSLTNQRDTFEANKKRVEDELNKIITSIDTLNADKKAKEDTEKNLTAHIEAVNKMNTLIKRDFRGILLQDIITYIDNRMKDYSSKIFNTNEISLALDGNNVDITFCNKDYENLSGGEKQRVDVITQFAIRNMLVKYLNFSSNILVLDEITDALDSISCDKVINFITTELTDIESVFIISHHADSLDICADSEIVVTKDIHGVSTITKQ